jgi:hypothetical protein
LPPRVGEKNPPDITLTIFQTVSEGAVSEVRRHGVLGSCARPFTPSHWASLRNAAGLITP